MTATQERIKLLHRKREALMGFVGKTRELKEEVNSFCILCWSIKDYFINDVGLPRKAIEDFAKAHPQLEIVADIANRDKHYVLDRPRLNAEIKNADIKVSFPLGIFRMLPDGTFESGDCTMSINYWVYDRDGNRYRLWQVLADAFSIWCWLMERVVRDVPDPAGKPVNLDPEFKGTLR